MISPVKWGEFSLENIPKENKLHSPHGLVQLCRYLKKKYCKLHHAELCGYLHKFEKIWMQSVIDYSKTRLSHESQSFFVSIFSRCKRIHKVCKVEYPLLRE